MLDINLKNLRKDAKYKLQKGAKVLSLTLASVALFSTLATPVEAAAIDPTLTTTTVYASTTTASVRVVDIVDTTIGTNITLPQVTEKIYTDSKYDYYLYSPKSQFIVVKYSNGAQKNIRQALNDGDITIKTLEKYGIRVYKEKIATITSVVDNSKKPGVSVPQVTEKIYEDDKNEYYLPTKKSTLIIVTYSNGTQKNIKEALNDGDITIKTLQDTYGIRIITQKKATITGVVDRTNGRYLPQTLEKIYEDDKNEYYFNVPKSPYVFVKFSNGTEKNIKDALRDGDITISQLQNVYGYRLTIKPRTFGIVSVVDNSTKPGVYVPQVIEKIYSDGENNYYFSTQKSSLVIVTYTNGTQKNIKQALKDGDLTIGDLQLTYGISVTAEKVDAKNNYYRPGELYKAPDGSYWTSKKEYIDWVNSQEKGYQYRK